MTDKPAAKVTATKMKIMNVAILGAGDSGKSTFLKQVIQKFDHDFTGNTHLISNLKDNIIFSLKELMEVASQNKLKIPNMERLVEADKLTPEVAAMIEELPSDSAFNDLLIKYGDTLGLQGGTSGTIFLFKSAVRIASENYSPTDEDKMWARTKTTGIEKVTIELLNALKVTIFDIGGQRSERKKWPKIFNNVGLIVFMVALNEYDMVLEEDEKKNRLHESLKIWQKLTKSPHFENAHFILLFNKRDIFEKKIVLKPLNQMFMGYDDFAKAQNKANQYEIGCAFLEDLFKKRFSGKVPFQTCITNSTDKADFELLWIQITNKIDLIFQEYNTSNLKTSA